MNYREATLHARTGGVIRRGGREIRFPTLEEAEHSHGEELNPNLPRSRFGLYEVGADPKPFRATAEDIAATDWTADGVLEPTPEVVPPEAVDEVLHEEGGSQ